MNIVIADDTAAVRKRIKVLLSDLPDVHIVGEAGDVPEATRLIETLKPDAVILDFKMPGGTGLDVLGRIKGLRPAPRVIMLTNRTESHYQESFRNAGAELCFDKSYEFERVRETLRAWIDERKSPPSPTS